MWRRFSEVGGTLANAKTGNCDRGRRERPPLARGPFRQRACKPDPVVSDHLSHRDRSPEGPPKRPCGLPGPRRAGSTVLFGLAPGGVCLAAASPRRRCALTAPFHLCLYATHVWPRHRPCVSVALSRGFPRVGVTHRPRPMVSGLSSRGFLSPRGRSARLPMVALAPPTAIRLARDCIEYPAQPMPVAVVTGAGGGLGRAIALDLAGRGYLRPGDRRRRRRRSRDGRGDRRRRNRVRARRHAIRRPARRPQRRPRRAADRSTSGSTTPASSSPATPGSRTRRRARRCSTSTRSAR